MTRILQKIRIDSVDTVDRGAGEGVHVKLLKRHDNAPPTAFETREKALQAIADRETAQAMAKSQPVGRAPTEPEQYLARLYAPVTKRDEPAPASPW